MREAPNPILQFLTAKAKPDGDSYRANRRQATSSTIELSWIVQGCWKSTTARLIDISRGGAAVSARETPPVGCTARLRFVEGEGSPWVEVKILGIDDLEKGRHRVRVRFDGVCPSFLLRLAVLGDAEVEDNSEPAPHYCWVTTESD